MQNKKKLIEQRIGALEKRLEKCDICPRNCGINRLKRQKGFCGTDERITVYTAFLHKGEEPAISGNTGSGTIFFSGCNLKCVFCQNYKFSHLVSGKTLTTEALSDLMLKLQDKGASNINLVTPTHFLPQILKSLYRAISKGLSIPIVYNTSGYEKTDILENLDGIVDIYLPDMKYANSILSDKYSNAADYGINAKKAILEMYRQKSKAVFKGELLQEGLVIRHLTLPGNTNDTIEILRWIQKNTPKVLVSVMFQYQPYFKAEFYPELSNRIDFSQYGIIKDTAQDFHLDGWIQDFNQEEDLAGVYFEQDDEFI